MKKNTDLKPEKIIKENTNIFPIGNQFWKLRSKHGRDKIFATPELLIEAASEYFQWCESNPLKETQFHGKDATKCLVDKMRPFTMEGLCSYLHVNTLYFRDFKKGIADKTDKLSGDFSQIITHIEETIYNQQFTGSASGFLNPNIIARKLGLTEKSESNTTNHNTTVNIDASKFNTDELKNLLNEPI